MKTKPNPNLQFLDGGGEMGKFIREKDWTNTSIGSPEFWPQSLRTTLSIILNSKFPMYLFWGKNQVCFYNDAYRPSLGIDGKHPSILGMKGEEAWIETWDFVKPMLQGVIDTGEATWNENLLLPIYRNGKMEDGYWTFSYSPVKDKKGKSKGIFVTCTETTENVHTIKKLEETTNRFQAMADNIPNLAWMANADGGIYWYNKQWYDYTATTFEEMEGWGWQKVHDPEMLPSVMKKWQASIDSGEPFEMVFPLKGGDGNFRQFLTRVLPLKNEKGAITQWFGTNTDVTVQKEIEEALIESKDQLEFAIEATELGTFDYNPLTNSFSANKRLKEWFGLPPNEQIQLPDAIDTIAEKDKDRVNEAIKKVLEYESGGKFNIEYTIIHPLTKKETIVHAKGRAWFNEEKIAFRFNGTLQDITEKTTTQNKLEASEKRFREAVEQAPAAIAIFRGDNFVVEVANKMAQELCGKYADELLNKPVFEALPETAAGFGPILQQVYESGKPFIGNELPVTLVRNGKEEDIFVNIMYEPLYCNEKKINGIINIGIDVTEQVLANKKIEASEQKFRLLADAIPQPIWTADAEGNLNYYNHTAFDYSGLTAEQMFQVGWMEIVHPDDREENIKLWTDAVTIGKDFLFEHRFRKYNGEYRWHLSRAIPQKDENGKTQMWVGTSTDIQDQKNFTNELEKLVLERTQELLQKNIDLGKMNTELQSFAYVSSHDLQEPLRKIQIFTSRIADKDFENLTENGKEYFTKIQTSANRMQTLIQDLLTYSRTNTGDRKFENESLDALIDEVKEELSEELDEKNATIESHNIGYANVITFQFRQLLHNLIGNSLKFSKPNEITVIKLKSEIVNGDSLNNPKFDKNTKYFHLSYSDNGIGFSPQYSEKIFEMFQRLHNTEYKGTGIGLSIVKKIVENHNGVIIASSGLNKGATFDIFIPV